MLTQPSRLLATGLVFLAATPSTSASVIQPRQNQGRDRPWVSVDESGSARTYTPFVTRFDGTTSHVYAPPHTLTGTVFTITETDGAVTTSTGNPPPPRATDADGGQGVFAVCRDNANSNIAPFCQPRNGTELYVDEPYYITWDTHHFSPDIREEPVHIQGIPASRGSGGSSSSNDQEPLFTLGLDNETLTGDGYHVWTPREAHLDGHDNHNEIRLRLVFNASSSGSEVTRTGATISVLPSRDVKPEGQTDDDDDDDSSSGGGGGGPPAAAIAVPIVVVVLLLVGIGGFFLFRKRRREAAAGAGADAGNVKRTSSGFRNRAGDAGDPQKNNNDIELTPSPTSPRTPGSNAFREEIARQDVVRGTET